MVTESREVLQELDLTFLVCLDGDPFLIRMAFKEVIKELVRDQLTNLIEFQNLLDSGFPSRVDGELFH